MCEKLHCPLHGRTCDDCLNSGEGEADEVRSGSGAEQGAVRHG